MRKLAVAVAASLVLCAARVDAQESAQINCGLPDPTLRFPVFTAPGSASIITNLSCGQEVTMLGIEGGYAKIQIGDRVRIYPVDFPIEAATARTHSRPRAAAHAEYAGSTADAIGGVCKRGALVSSSRDLRGLLLRAARIFGRRELARVELLTRYESHALPWCSR